MTEARGHSDADKWAQAAQQEMNSLNEHNTWSVPNFPQGERLWEASGSDTSVGWWLRGIRKPKGLTTMRLLPQWQDLGAFGPC